MDSWCLLEMGAPTAAFKKELKSQPKPSWLWGKTVKSEPPGRQAVAAFGQMTEVCLCETSFLMGVSV